MQKTVPLGDEIFLIQLQDIGLQHINRRIGTFGAAPGKHRPVQCRLCRHFGQQRQHGGVEPVIGKGTGQAHAQGLFRQACQHAGGIRPGLFRRYPFRQSRYRRVGFQRVIGAHRQRNGADAFQRRLHQVGVGGDLGFFAPHPVYCSQLMGQSLFGGKGFNRRVALQLGLPPVGGKGAVIGGQTGHHVIDLQRSQQIFRVADFAPHRGFQHGNHAGFQNVAQTPVIGDALRLGQFRLGGGADQGQRVGLHRGCGVAHLGGGIQRQIKVQRFGRGLPRRYIGQSARQVGQQPFLIVNRPGIAQETEQERQPRQHGDQRRPGQSSAPDPLAPFFGSGVKSTQPGLGKNQV